MSKFTTEYESNITRKIEDYVLCQRELREEEWHIRHLSERELTLHAHQSLIDIRNRAALHEGVKQQAFLAMLSNIEASVKKSREIMIAICIYNNLIDAAVQKAEISIEKMDDFRLDLLNKKIDEIKEAQSKELKFEKALKSSQKMSFFYAIVWIIAFLLILWLVLSVKK